ncbi:hypothetical protein [Aureimonas populi]|uniref:Uncharacterized protein n=1 Tax=Aureimonas populi TaxID=1701758 RepID=A0ABW5CJ76_9HYPH|nr:hypothetical protein [Aureimonas populi]
MASNLDKTIREQQARDVTETVAPDETRERARAGDSDAASSAARKAAMDHPIADPAKGQDDVLSANEASAGHDGDRRPHGHQKGPLVGRGRSILGR